jgi:hypothetical protein
MSKILRPDLRTTVALALVPAVLLLVLGFAARADAAGDWGTPIPISAEGEYSTNARVAGNPDGDQVAAWQHTLAGGHTVIQIASRHATGAWSAPEDISETSGQGIYPSVAVDASGEAFVAWMEEAGGEPRLEFSRGDVSGGPWTIPQPVPGSQSGVVASPTVLLDASGDAVVTWASFGSTDEVMAATEKEGTWSTTTLDASNAVGPRFISAAVEPDGEAAIVWNLGEEAIQVATADIGGHWAVQTLASGSDPYTAPRVAFDGAGMAEVTWSDGGAFGTPTLIEVARRSVLGSWGSAEVVPTGSDAVTEPAIALGPEGEETLAWVSMPTGQGGEYLVSTASRPIGGSWTTPITLGTTVKNFEPRILVTAGGDAYVEWRGTDPSENEEFVAMVERTAEGTWGPELILNEEDEDTFGPVFDVDRRGDVTILWSAIGEGQEVVHTLYREGEAPESEPTPTSSGSNQVSSSATAAAPDLGPAVCSAPVGVVTAKSFAPATKEPGRTVPGLRVRIRVPAPSNVDVAATITWKDHGRRHSTTAGTYSMSVGRRRNLRVPLPRSLRAKLPLGSKADLSLRIASTPAGSSPCAAATTTTRRLRAKVVNVLTSAS